MLQQGHVSAGTKIDHAIDPSGDSAINPHGEVNSVSSWSEDSFTAWIPLIWVFVAGDDHKSWGELSISSLDLNLVGVLVNNAAEGVSWVISPVEFIPYNNVLVRVSRPPYFVVGLRVDSLELVLFT